MGKAISALMLGSCVCLAAEYEYVENTTRYVTIARGNTISVGKLDSDGNFRPDRRWIDMENIMSTRGGRVLNIPWNHEKKVYEFRSGRLIRGELDNDGNFKPELGSTIISFADYKYSPDALRIYNLPGKFVEKRAGGAGGK